MIQRVFHKIHTDELIDRVLSADTAGRAKMADGYFVNAIIAKFADALFAADAGSRAKFAASFVDSGLILDGAVILAKMPDGVLSADVAGRAKVADGFVNSAKVLDGDLVKGDLAADTIRLEVPIPILTNEQAGLAADGTAGVRYTTAYTFLISTDMLQSAKAVYIEADIEASNADSVTAVELYDSAAGVVRGSASANAGDRVRSADLKASLVGGNEHQVKINVTTVSATAGATTGVRRAALVLVVGIS